VEGNSVLAFWVDCPLFRSGCIQTGVHLPFRVRCVRSFPPTLGRSLLWIYLLWMPSHCVCDLFCYVSVCFVRYSICCYVVLGVN